MNCPIGTLSYIRDMPRTHYLMKEVQAIMNGETPRDLSYTRNEWQTIPESNETR